MATKTFKTDIAREYVKRFSRTASLTLARKVYVENIDHFRDVEDARRAVRYVRGLAGKRARKLASEKDLFIPKFSLGNPFRLPKSHAKKQRTLTLPKEYDRVLVISDLHVPYHDVEALSVAIDYGRAHDVNCIFINGDLMDFFQVSRFTKVHRKRSVAQELETARQLLTAINDTFPGVPIYFLLGNHDVRLQNYLAEKAPELLDMEEFRLEELLEARKHNMVVLDEKVLVKIGKLTVTHGHLLIRGIMAPVNSARGAFMKAKASTLISHVHKVSTHVETTINGKTIVCYSTGCMCELNPDYVPFANNYSHGFAFVRTEKGGNFRVKNLQVLNGVIVN